jgi:hypothetical protein
MKRITTTILTLILFCSIPAFAANEFIPFTTIDQAETYCPAINALTFTAMNPSPQSVGTITGSNQATFESFPVKSAIHPKNIDSSGLIQDAQFRSYISNNVVTCLYSYTTFADVQYALVMRSK